MKGRRINIGLQARVVVFILSFGILTGLIGVAFTYLSGINAIKNSIGASFKEMAAEVAARIGIIVETELNRLRIYAITPLNFQGSGVLGRLKAFQTLGEGKYTQILLLDPKGRVISATNSLEKDYVTREDWWEGVNSSKDGVFIGDIKWDTPIKGYTMDFAVRIEDRGKIRGVIKATVKVDHLFKAITDLKIGETGHANLVSSDGIIIVCPIFPPKSHMINFTLLSIITTASAGWDTAPEDGHGGKNSIIGFAPVRYTLLQNPANFGGKKWYIFIRQHPRETYAGIRTLLWKVSIFAVSSIAIISILGFLIANRIVKPIKILQKGASLIGKGDLGHRLDIRTGDEMEQLASEFNIMANKLKESYDGLKETTEYLHSLLENANDIIWTTDLRGNITYINKKVEEWGYSRDELIGKSFLSLLSERHKGRRFQRTLVEGIKQVYEVEVRDKKGEIRNAIISSSPMKDKNGNIIDVLAILRDITEQKRLELLTLESEKLATIGMLSTAIAHEIRNPLSSVKMNLQILYKSLDLEGDEKEHFKIAMEEVDHLERILQNLLDFARPPEPYFALHEINEILDTSFHLVEKEIREKRIRIIRNYAEGLPKVSIDAGRIKQALINLYLNAIQAMEPEGILEVSTSAILHSEKGAISIDICDNGCGIDRKTLGHIFEPFFTTKSGGTGLGLSVVKKIIEQHKGEIMISSDKGKGTRVTLLLPLI